MDNRYYDNVIKEMQPFFDEHSFKSLENGNFSNGTKEIAIKYDEVRQMYTLSVAQIDEGSAVGEFSEINAWLFDDSQNANDAISVGIDFVNSLRKDLGVKIKRAAAIDAIDLPTASKSGNMNITGFTKKMLDVFPALKPEYKNHVALYGNFLYINFFGEQLVPLLNKLFTTGTSKQIKKLYDVFGDAYIKGDKDTVNIMVALLCAASYEDDTATAAVREMLKDNSHFLMSYNNFIPTFANNKKLKSALIK